MNFKSLLLVALALFSACPVWAQKSKPLDPDAIIKNLYAAAKADKSPFFQSKSRALLDPYFTKSLGDLIWKDFQDAKGEVGSLDFDPLYGSQDPQIKDLVIMDTGWGGDKKSGPEDEAVVQVTFKDSGKKVMVSYQFVQGKDKQWRIDNIRYPSLDNLLLRDLFSPAKAVK
jgi:Protein of unknown function (DUF3828)